MKTHGLICQSLNKIYPYILTYIYTHMCTIRKKYNKRQNKNSKYIASGYGLKIGEKNAVRPNA